MAPAAADIDSMVYRPAVINDDRAFSLDRRMLAVLLEFDGSRTVAEIAQRLNLDLAVITATVSRLSELALIEPAAAVATALDPTVIDFVTKQLARAVGPLAVVLVEDEIHRLGCAPDGVPVARLKELIDRLSASIRKEDQKKSFMAAMAAVNPAG